MVSQNHAAVEQVGDITVFKRLIAKDNRVPENLTPRALYDHIRMTDICLYPSAWLEHGDWILEFSDPVLSGDEVSAKVVFKKRPNNE